MVAALENPTTLPLPAKVSAQSDSPLDRTMKNMLFWLSSTSGEILESCGKAEERKYIAVGLSVVIPATMGFVVGKYTASTLVSDPVAIYSIAIIWATIVLLTDILLLAAARPTDTRYINSFFFVVLRLVIAAVLGVSVSHPFTLYIFRDTIEAKINEIKLSEINAVMDSYRTQKGKYHSDLSRYNRNKEDAWNKQKSEIAAYQQPYAGQNSKEGQPPRSDEDSFAQQERLLIDEINKLKDEVLKYTNSISSVADKIADEIAGRGKTKRPKCGEACWAYKSEENTLKKLVKKINEEIDSKNAQLEKLRNTQREIDKEKTMSYIDRINKIQESTEKERKARLDSILKATEAEVNRIDEQIKRDQEALAGLDSKQKSAIELLEKNPKADILSKSIALDKVFEGEGGGFARFIYYLLMVLFILIDMIPVIGKSLTFTVNGLYAKALLMYEKSTELELQSAFREREDKSKSREESVKLSADKRKIANSLHLDRYTQEFTAKSTREAEYNLHCIEAEYDKKNNILKNAASTAQIRDFHLISDQAATSFRDAIEKRRTTASSSQFHKIKEREEEFLDKIIDDYYDDQNLLEAEFYINRKDRYSQSSSTNQSV